MKDKDKISSPFVKGEQDDARLIAVHDMSLKSLKVRREQDGKPPASQVGYERGEARDGKDHQGRPIGSWNRFKKDGS